MLENTDTLLSLAEIAAAFAGFAALVSVLRRPGSGTSESIHDLLRLRLVISSGVAGVAAALIPVGLAGYGLSAESVWRLSALFFILFGNGIIVSFVRAYTPVRGSFPPDRLAVWLVSAIELLEQGSLLIVAIGWFTPNAPALYTTALIANICQAGFIFVRFVGSTFSYETEISESEEAAPPNRAAIASRR